VVGLWCLMPHSTLLQ